MWNKLVHLCALALVTFFNLSLGVDSNSAFGAQPCGFDSFYVDCGNALSACSDGRVCTIEPLSLSSPESGVYCKETQGNRVLVATCGGAPAISACVSDLSGIGFTDGGNSLANGVRIVNPDIQNTIVVRVIGSGFVGFPIDHTVGLNVTGPTLVGSPSGGVSLTTLWSAGSRGFDVTINYGLNSGVQGLQALKIALEMGLDRKIVAQSTGLCPDVGPNPGPSPVPGQSVSVFVGAGLDLAITDFLVDLSSPGVLGAVPVGTNLPSGTILAIAPGPVFGPIIGPEAIQWHVKVQGANVAGDPRSVNMSTQLDGNGPASTEPPGPFPVSLSTLAGGAVFYFTDTFGAGAFGRPDGRALINGGFGQTIQETTFANNSINAPVLVVPGLSISKVMLTQAIDNFTLDPGTNLLSDLVLGKSTVLAVDVTADYFPEHFPAPSIAQTPVTLLVRTTDGSTAFSTTTNFSNLKSSRSTLVPSRLHTFTVTSPTFRPMNPGEFRVEVQSNILGVTTNLFLPTRSGATVPTVNARPVPPNAEIADTFRVKATRLAINYVRLEGGACFEINGANRCTLPLDEPTVSAMLPLANEYVQEVYPIADQPPLPVLESGVISEGTPASCPPLADPAVVSNPDPNDLGAVLLSCDLLNTWNAGLRPGVTNIVGIAPKGYFDLVHPGAVGITAKIVPALRNRYNVSLVAQGFPSMVRHEIGHQYGLIHTGNAFVPKPVLSNGSLLIDSNNFRDFMAQSGCADPHDPASCRSPSLEWVSAFSWQTLFGFLRNNPSDPEIMKVPILFEPSGGADIYSTSLQMSDVLTQDDENGRYAIQLRDPSGAILYEVRFTPVSETVDSEGTISPLSHQFFLGSIPILPGTAAIEILRDGIALKKINPNEQLLRDAVLAIPDHGFVKLPNQRRKALLNKVETFSKQLVSNSPRGALNKLENDIRKSIADWVLESYEVSSSLQMTQSQVLATIDLLIERLRNSQ